MSEREAMEFDVVIVGAGARGAGGRHPPQTIGTRRGHLRGGKKPAKSARISCPAPWSSRAPWTSCCRIGANWAARSKTLATEDHFVFLTRTRAFESPVLPPQMHNKGNYICSLGNVVRWATAPRPRRWAWKSIPAFPRPKC